MATEKQLEANRENAKLGGVKTEKGKAISRYNAIKHGLLSHEVLLAGESEDDLVELGKRLRVELKPETQLELILVDRIVANTWRLKRTMRIETDMIENDYKNTLSFDEGREKSLGQAFSSDFAENDTYGKFIRYETSIERGLYKALHELQRIQAARRGEMLPLPLAVDIDVNTD